MVKPNINYHCGLIYIAQMYTYVCRISDRVSWKSGLSAVVDLENCVVRVIFQVVNCYQYRLSLNWFQSLSVFGLPSCTLVPTMPPHEPWSTTVGLLSPTNHSSQITTLAAFCETEQVAVEDKVRWVALRQPSVKPSASIKKTPVVATLPTANYTFFLIIFIFDVYDMVEPAKKANKIFV